MSASIGNSSIAKLKSDYGRLKGQALRLEEGYGAKSKAITRLTNQLAALGDDVGGLKDSMDEKGTSINDETPVVAIRAAVRRLRGEILEMDVRMAVAEHVLATKRGNGPFA